MQSKLTAMPIWLMNTREIVSRITETSVRLEADGFGNLIFMPSAARSSVTAAILDEVVAKESFANCEKTLAVVTLSEQSLRPIREYMMQRFEVGLNGHVPAHLLHDQAKAEIALVEKEVARFLAPGAENRLMLECISVQRGGRRTTVVDEVQNRVIGLHVDQWHRELDDTKLHPQRFAINLGQFTRELLVIPRWIKFSQFLDRADEKLSSVKDATLELLGSGDLPPLLSVKVYPGEAYIGPTANFIHDGATLSVNGWDVCLVFRGHFSFESTDTPSQFRR